MSTADGVVHVVRIITNWSANNVFLSPAPRQNCNSVFSCCINSRIIIIISNSSCRASSTAVAAAEASSDRRVDVSWEVPTQFYEAGNHVFYVNLPSPVYYLATKITEIHVFLCFRATVRRKTPTNELRTATTGLLADHLSVPVSDLPPVSVRYPLLPDPVSDPTTDPTRRPFSWQFSERK